MIHVNRGAWNEQPGRVETSGRLVVMVATLAVCARSDILHAAEEWELSVMVEILVCKYQQQNKIDASATR